MMIPLSDNNDCHMNNIRACFVFSLSTVFTGESVFPLCLMGWRLCVYVCAGGSGGAAHSSQRYVAAAAEAERPERAGAAAGSGEEMVHYFFFVVLRVLYLSVASH